MKHLNLALAVSLLGCGSLRDYPLDVPADRPVDATDGAVSDTPTDQPTPTDLPTDNGPADVPTVDVPAADVPRADVLADVPLTDVPLIDVPSVDVPPMDVAVDAGSADVPLDVSAADVPMDVQVADLPLDVPVDAGAADVPLDVPADVPRVDAGVDAATDVVVPCAMGQTRCGGACVNLLADVMHCGACGNACASGTSCIAQGASAQCRRTHWNVNTDTDWLTNPNTDGAWSFGRDRSELFALATMRAPVMGSAGICAGWGTTSTAAMFINTCGITGFGLRPGMVSLHPGSPGVSETTGATIRWTAPIDGVYRIRATFHQGDSGRETYVVLRSMPGVGGSETVAREGPSSTNFSVDEVRRLRAREVLDFMVFGDPVSGNTPLEVLIDYGGNAPPSACRFDDPMTTFDVSILAP
jgi:hypothetical protein